jgi:Cu-processing system permease protein
MAWLMIVFLSDLGVMGTAAALNLPPGAVLWLSLANPLQAFKLGAVDALHGALDILGPSGRYAADLLQQRLGLLMAVVLAVWAAAAAGAAAWLFHRTGAR